MSALKDVEDFIQDKRDGHTSRKAHRILYHVVILSKVAKAFDVCFYAFPVMQTIEPVEA